MDGAPKLLTCIKTHDETKQQIFCLTKTEGLPLSNSQVPIKNGTIEDSETKQLIKFKTKTNKTVTKTSKPLLEIGHCRNNKRGWYDEK